MSEVRQAHLPGNYEMYDESSNTLGPQICKFCWEKDQVRNSSSLDTVWLTVDGWSVVWWICKGHHSSLGKVEPTWRVLKSESTVVRSPVLFQ